MGITKLDFRIRLQEKKEMKKNRLFSKITLLFIKVLPLFTQDYCHLE